MAELQKETEGYPQFANYDDLGGQGGNDQSTAAASGADTPSAVATPKLKLTFNSGNRDNAAAAGAGNGVNETD